jgi:hypothetical protein
MTQKMLGSIYVNREMETVETKQVPDMENISQMKNSFRGISSSLDTEGKRSINLKTVQVV